MNNQAIVFWLTGLSGAGKSTIAHRFAEAIRKKGKTVKILDGDDIRKKSHKHLNFTVDDIKENNRLIADICSNQLNYYDIILVSVISPFQESRQLSREIIGTNYHEVYIKTSLETVIKRDAKGLYKKALDGEIENFIGISPNVPYEPPNNADIILDTEQNNIDYAVNALNKFVKKKYPHIF